MELNFSERVAWRWLHCSCCDKTIGKDEVYYHEYIYNGGGRGYRNFCVRCAISEMHQRVEFYQQKLSNIKIYTKVKEEADDRRETVGKMDSKRN